VQKFSLNFLVDAICVNLEVVKAILCSLLCIEPELLIARLVLASVVCKVLEGNFVSIGTLGVRKDCIGKRDRVVVDLSENEVASVAALQKTHCFALKLDGGCGRNGSCLGSDAAAWPRDETAAC
jgi:hypothetical protein